MKKKKTSPKLTNLVEKLRSDFDSWESIPTKSKKPSDKQRREELYTELKEKIEKLSD